jgi:hypothetical protein
MAIPHWKRERVCQRFGCVERFIPKHRDQKFHSEECRYADYNEHRVRVRIDSSGMKARSLKANQKNEAVRAMSFFSTMPHNAKLLVMEWCAQTYSDAKKKARECARLENYRDAEHWRAMAVFSARLKQLLTR